LQHALSILFHTIKEDWQASEEMEKMREFPPYAHDLLPKRSNTTLS
jgi:hypothetical protein